MTSFKSLRTTLVSALVGVAVLAPALPANAEPLSAQASCPITEFGYRGNYMCGTDPLRADWNGDGVLDEVFVVSPGRTIWHAWPGSGGWQRLSNGAADNMGAWWVFTNGTRAVSAWVMHSGYWCTHLVPNGQWTNWYKC